MEQWRGRFGLVLIPVDGLGAGQLDAKFASSSDGMIVFVSHGADETELEEVRRLAGLLEHHRTHCLGGVHGAVSLSSPSQVWPSRRLPAALLSPG